MARSRSRRSKSRSRSRRRSKSRRRSSRKRSHKRSHKRSRRSSRKRSKSRKRRSSRSSRILRAMRSPSLAARIDCLRGGKISFKTRSGKIRCRDASVKRRSAHQKRHAPTEYDYLASKTVKKLKKLAKSKGIAKYSTKKKTGLIRSILNH